MKKLKTAVLALAVSAALTAAAYAAWSQEIKIEGTVNTGAVEVQFTEWKIRSDPHIKASIVRLDPRSVQVTIEDLYPAGRRESGADWGGRVWVDVTMTNTGSVPVKFAAASLSFDEEGSLLLPYLKSWCWLRYDEDGDGPKPEVSHGYIQHPWGSLSNLADAFNGNTLLKSLVLEPGGWISFEADEGEEEEEVKCICIKLDGSAPAETQGKSVTFTLQMDFVQWNR